MLHAAVRVTLVEGSILEYLNQRFKEQNTAESYLFVLPVVKGEKDVVLGVLI